MRQVVRVDQLGEGPADPGRAGQPVIASKAGFSDVIRPSAETDQMMTLAVSTRPR